MHLLRILYLTQLERGEETKHWNIYITISFSNKMSTLKIHSRRNCILSVTIGITEICVAHCLKWLTLCNTKDFPFEVQWPAFHLHLCNITQVSLTSVFQSFSGSIFPLFWFYYSWNLTPVNPKMTVMSGSYERSPADASQHPLCIITWRLMSLRNVCLNIAGMNIAHDLCQCGTLLNWETKETGEKQ